MFFARAGRATGNSNGMLLLLAVFH